MPVLLALHDAEGDENDLPPVLRMVAPGWHVLSPRLTADMDELVLWIEANAASVPYAFAYGTGADLAGKLLLQHAGAIAGGILLRPSEIEIRQTSDDLNGAPVLIVTGGAGECAHLARTLSAAGALVDLAMNPEGRHLTPEDFSLAKRWLDQTLASENQL